MALQVYRPNSGSVGSKRSSREWEWCSLLINGAIQYITLQIFTNIGILKKVMLYPVYPFLLFTFILNMFKMYRDHMTDMFINIHNRFSLSCLDYFSVNTSHFILLLVCSHFLHVTKTPSMRTSTSPTACVSIL